MGPYEVNYLSLILGVLKDWRAIAVAVLVLLSWALLRYVGMVFRGPRVALPPSRRMIKKQEKAMKPAAEELEEEED